MSRGSGVELAARSARRAREVVPSPPWPPGARLAQAGTPTPAPGGTPDAIWQQVEAWARTDTGSVVLALAVLVGGWYASKLAVRYMGRPMARRFRRPSVARTVLRGVRMTVLAGTVFVALTVLGLPLGDVVLPVTVFSAVLGIVLAPIVGSVINGLFVLADQPYEVGDMVEVADLGQGTRGFVEDITLRYTKIFTLDNTFLVIPNSLMRERDVLNYSAEDERTRLTLQLLVTYESDVEAARAIVERAARDVDDVITGGPDIRIGSARYPAGPTCYVDEYADHGVLLTLRYWAKRPYKLLTVRSKVNERIWTALEDADVDIAYPHQHVVFDETSGRLQVGLDEGPGRAPAGARGRLGPAGGRERPATGGQPGEERVDRSVGEQADRPGDEREDRSGDDPGDRPGDDPGDDGA